MPEGHAQYYYDGLNRRIRATVYDTDGETELSDTRYIYNGGWQADDAAESPVS